MYGKPQSTPRRKLPFLKAREKPKKHTKAAGTSIKITSIKYAIGSDWGKSEKSCPRPIMISFNKRKMINAAGMAC
jgi:hypothetical protein